MDIENLNEIINKIKNYLNLNLIKEDIYVKILSEDKLYINLNDFNFLYMIIIKGLNLDNNIIIKIFIENNNKIEHEVIVDNITEKKNELKLNVFKNIFFDLLNISILIYVKPKIITILWNDINIKLNIQYLNINKHLDISSILSISNDDKNKKTNYNIVKINFKDLIDYTNNNYDDIKFYEKFKQFNNLHRVIGINNSANIKLNYSLKVQLDTNNILLLNLYDTINTKHIIIKNKSYDINKINDIINDFILLLLKRKDIQDYVKLFISIEYLRDYLKLLYNKNPSPLLLLNIQQNIIIPYIKIPKQSLNIYCEHENELENLKIISPEYNTNMNKFITKYIIYNNNLPICYLCNYYIPMFTISENIYIKRKGELLITNIKENIFLFTPYNKFIDAQISINQILNNFDLLFKTNNIMKTNNIGKLIIDWFIFINNKRLEFEELYSKIINNSDLFFLRAVNNIFDINFNIKEKFYIKKMINFYTMIILIILLTSSFSEYLIILKNIKTNNLTTFFYKVIYKFINKSLNVIPLKLDIIIDTYLNLLTPELINIYNLLKYKWNNNIYLINTEKIYINISSELCNINIVQIDNMNNNNNKLNIYKYFIYNKLYNNINNLNNSKIISINDILKSYNYNIFNKFIINNIKFDIYHSNTLIPLNQISINQNVFKYKNIFYKNDNVNEYNFKIISNNNFLLFNYNKLFNINDINEIETIIDIETISNLNLILLKNNIIFKLENLKLKLIERFYILYNIYNLFNNDSIINK